MSQRTFRNRPEPDPKALHHVAWTPTVHHPRSSMKRRGPHRVGELNLTSMLDVTFLLLIFFVLTASFAVGEGLLPADLPAGPGPSQVEEAAPPRQPIRITLRSRGGEGVAIHVPGVSGPLAGFRELYTQLRRLQNRPSQPGAPYNPDDPVMILPGPTVRWGQVVGAFNAAVRAEYTNVHFAQPHE